jgi:hypothetical protein
LEHKKKPIAVTVDYVLCLPYGIIVPLGNLLKCVAVTKSVDQDGAVAVVVDIFLYYGAEIRIAKFTHFFFTLILPEPWHMLHLRYPLLPPVLRVLFLMVTVCFAAV